MARRLGRAQAVERQRDAAGADLGVGEAVAGGEPEPAERDARIDLDSAADDRFQVAALAELAAGGDEADAAGRRPAPRRA